MVYRVVYGVYGVSKAEQCINAYYTIYDVKAQFNLAEFGRQYIPGFKSEMGYGYYEFKKEDEHFKPYKRVILIHKVKRLQSLNVM